MKLIPLGKSKSRHAVVDDDDYERVIEKGPWYVQQASPDHCYVATTIGKRPNGGPIRLYLHRFIVGAAKGEYVDHKDFDGLNNSKSNLRVCSQRQNMAHSRKRRTYGGRPTKNRFKGVHQTREGGKWTVRYRFRGKYRTGGVFRGEKMAAVAYRMITEAIHGDFAQS